MMDYDDRYKSKYDCEWEEVEEESPYGRYFSREFPFSGITTERELQKAYLAMCDEFEWEHRKLISREQAQYDEITKLQGQVRALTRECDNAAQLAEAMYSGEISKLRADLAQMESKVKAAEAFSKSLDLLHKMADATEPGHTPPGLYVITHNGVRTYVVKRGRMGIDTYDSTSIVEVCEEAYNSWGGKNSG